MTAHNDEQDAERSSSRGLVISIVISCVAIGLAVVHLAVPGIKIDAITIALFVLATAPWLAPLFKTVELPGGWKFEFREFKQEVQRELREGTKQVRDIAERVEEVAQFAITGAAPDTLKARLNRELSQFNAYLIDVGFELSGAPPTVEIPTESYENAHYDVLKNQIVLGKQFATSSDVLFREYSHHALIQLRGTCGLTGDQQDAVESALADYFPCSYRNDPELGREVAAYLGRVSGFDKPAIRNLDNSLTMNQVSKVDGHVASQTAGEVWGGAFWQIRKLLGKDRGDRLLLRAWRETPSGGEAERKFIEKLAELAGEQQKAVSEIFEQRSLPT